MLGEITEDEANQKVASLIENGIISIPEEDLAASMMKDTDLINDLFQ